MQINIRLKPWQKATAAFLAFVWIAAVFDAIGLPGFQGAALITAFTFAVIAISLARTSEKPPDNR